ncbi:MAG: hypothetical protein ACT4QB_07950 [Gammaproteobacteria bacterium]
MRTTAIRLSPGVSQKQFLHVLEPQPAAAALLNLRLPSREVLRSRVEYYYGQLKSLPRRARRALQRQWKRSLSAIALLLALGQAPALAATITVGGSCTLVDAIRAANTDAATGGCPAGSGADTLVLVPDSTHTLTAVEDTTYGPTGLPLVTSEITIAGNESTIERGGGAPKFRILAVGQPGNLSLQALTLSGGNAVFVEGVNSGAGGGAYNRGTLTLTDSTVSGNTTNGFDGGGVFNRGTLTLTHSTISGNTAGLGGGVSNRYYGTLTLTDSTISGNTASDGGGVSNYGTITLTNSTISGNTADNGGGLSGSGTATSTNSTITGNTALDRGGGVDASGLTLTNITVSANSARYGGGVHINPGNNVMIGSTVSGNSAHAGGGFFSRGSYEDGCFAGYLLLVNSTVSGNSADTKGGGIYHYIFSERDYVECGTVTLSNSTISGNTAAMGGGLYNFYNYGTAGTAITLARTLVSGNIAPDGESW